MNAGQGRGDPSGLVLRPLSPDSRSDEDALQELIDADPGYSRRADGRDPEPGDARGLLRGAPPGVDPEDKVVLGAFEGPRLVTVVDLVRGWPTAGTALVGLLQVHTNHQGRGLGRTVHDLSLEWLTRNWPEIQLVRAVVVAPNSTHADPFWHALGYRPQGTPVPYAGDRVRTTAQAWVRPLVTT